MKPLRVKTIAEFHRFRGLPPPEHPLISVVDFANTDTSVNPHVFPTSLVLDFYCIALKRNFPAKMHYGQQSYDYDEGVMGFLAPGQVFGAEPVHVKTDANPSGWGLFVHPDFLWNTSLAKTMPRYEYFGYAVHEALFLSEKEEATITAIVDNIAREYRANIDEFSQNIIISHIDLLLTYSQRFYHRQFLTRKKTNHRVLDKLETLLGDYFQGEKVGRLGLPTVQYVAEALNISPHYLSDLLKVLTGRSTQQHIHDRLIEQAKQELSTTDLTVSEIAFRLGFEHPPSFNKLFKQKTNFTPLDFRRSVS